MKASAITCAVLAGALGFSTLASAQEWDRHGGGDRDGERHEQRGDRYEHHGDRYEQRGDRYEHRGYVQGPRYEQRGYVQGPRYEQRAYAPRYYGYDHPHFYRGGYLPREYIQPSYYVNWQAYPGLYAPPYGYQWVQDDAGDFLLVALATGLIANLLTR